MKDKCSESYFKKIIGSYDEKIKKCSNFLNDNKATLDDRQFKLDNELDKMDKKIHSIDSKLYKCIGMSEMQKVWDQFQRFAEYKDLKHLHAIVIPEIAKFE